MVKYSLCSLHLYIPSFLFSRLGSLVGWAMPSLQHVDTLTHFYLTPIQLASNVHLLHLSTLFSRIGSLVGWAMPLLQHVDTLTHC